jgi:hypothetical protein
MFSLFPRCKIKDRPRAVSLQLRSNAKLFAGRSEQVDQIIGAICQKGYHVVLYGDRGVSKTSLSNVLVEFLNDVGKILS